MVRTTTWDAATGTVTIPARTVAVLVQPAKVASTTTLTTTTASVVEGGAATVDVVVTAPGAVPAGAIEIREGRTVVATGTLVGGKATIGLPGSFTATVGTHALTAAYLGSSAVAPSGSAALTLTVTARPVTPPPARASSTTALSPAQRTVTAGSTVTWTVRVRSAAAVSGTVEIRSGKKTLGSATVRNGVAKVRLSAKAVAAVGRTTVRAYYLGSGSVAPSRSATGTLKVTKATPRLTATAGRSGKLTVGKRATVAVSVTAPAGPARGTVTVVSGGRTVGKATLKKG